MAGTMKAALGTVTTPLAQELIDNLLKDVEDADILALRAVSRDAYQKSHNEFTTRFFTDRRVRATKTSLQQFIDICNYSELDLIANLDRVTFVHVDIWDERDQFAPLDPNCITIALKKLKNANVFPALRIGHTGYLDVHCATEMVLQGIAQADFLVKDLSLYDWDKTCSVLGDFAPLKDRLYSNISDLRRLSLDGCVYGNQASIFSEFLAAAPLLEHFSMDFDKENFSYLRGLTKAFPRNQLKSLEIRNSRFEPDELNDFLDNQRGRLTSLVLSYVRLESWQGDGRVDLLEKLGEQFNLDKIQLDLVAEWSLQNQIQINCEGRDAVQRTLFDAASDIRKYGYRINADSDDEDSADGLDSWMDGSYDIDDDDGWSD